MDLSLQLVDSKIIKILKVLSKKPEQHFHIQKLASESKLALSSTFRIVNKLVKLKIVEVMIIGKFKIYRINQKKMREMVMDK